LQQKLKSHMAGEVLLHEEIAILKKDFELTEMNSAVTASSLLNAKENLDKEKDELERSVKSLQMDVNLKIEYSDKVTEKLNAVTINLNSVTTEKKGLEADLEKANKGIAKMNKTETELGVIRDELNQLKLDQTKNGSLVSRLNAEKDASERKHGQRTALVGMLEAQLNEINENNAEAQAKLEAARYDLSQKDDECENTKYQLEKIEKELLDLQNFRKSTNDIAAQSADKEVFKKSKMTEALQKELQSLQQKMASKSAAAQRLLQKRETECKDLKRRVNLLQQELDKGTLSDRRIFELAAKQSNRESIATDEIKIRDTMLYKLTEKLINHDSDLASAEYTAQQTEAQIEELCRMQRREDINIDYLKSIVVQYLSKPPGSSERSALLPVLATLLQFDKKDYKMIAEGKDNVSWFGSVLPTLVTSPLENGFLQNNIKQTAETEISTKVESSAEIKLSSQPTSSNATRSTRSSLQY